MQGVTRRAARSGTGAVLVAICASVIVITLAVFRAAIWAPMPGFDLSRVLFIAGAGDVPDGDGLAWWSQAPSLERVAKYRIGLVNIGLPDRVQRLPVASVTAEFFDVFGALPQPTLGRSAVPTVVLSQSAARRWFPNGDEGTYRTILIDGAWYPVSAVAPADFQFPPRVAAWIVAPQGVSTAAFASSAPIVPDLQDGMVARLREGRSVAAVELECAAILKRMKEHYRMFLGQRVYVSPLVHKLTARFRPALRVSAIAAAVIYFLALLNLGGLFLAQSAKRSHEDAIRRALGATDARLLRSFALEAVSLGLLGSTAGVLLARLLLQVTPVFLPPSFLQLTTVIVTPLDAVLTVLFATVSSLLVMILVRGSSRWRGGGRPGLAPGGHLAGRPLSRGILNVLQTASSFALVFLAFLFVRTSWNLAESREAVRTQGLAVLAIPPRPSPGPELTMWRGLIESHGIHRFAIADQIPFGDGRSRFLSVLQGEASVMVRVSHVTPEIFDLTGPQLIAGATFPLRHREAGTVIVSRSLAEAFWPDRPAVGEALKIEQESAARRVIGVVETIPSRSDPASERELQLYLPLHEAALENRELFLILDPGRDRTLQNVAATLARMGPPFSDAAPVPYSALAKDAYAAYSNRGFLFSGLAAVAVFLAAVGFFVAIREESLSRRQEAGIRIALGAGRWRLIGQLLSRTIVTLTLGLTGGALISAWAASVATHFVYGVPALDAFSLVLSALAISATAAAATIPSALLAANLDVAGLLRRDSF